MTGDRWRYATTSYHHHHLLLLLLLQYSFVFFSSSHTDISRTSLPHHDNSFAAIATRADSNADAVAAASSSTAVLYLAQHAPFRSISRFLLSATVALSPYIFLAIYIFLSGSTRSLSFSLFASPREIYRRE